MYLVFLLYSLFASIFTLSKKGLEYTDPLFFVGSRMLFAGFLLILWQHGIKKKPIKLNRNSCFTIFLLALFNIYLTNMFEFWGLSHLTSLKTCFIYSLSPFLTALFSYYMFSETMNRSKWTGLLIGSIGLIPFLLDQSGEEILSGSFFFLSIAEIYVLLATLCSVYGWLLLRRTVSEYGVSFFTANGFSMILGGSFALIHSRLTENWSPTPIKEVMPFLLCALPLVLISNIICYNLYGWLLKRFSGTFMSFCGFTTPFFAAFFGWFFLSEKIPPSFFLSSLILFFGLVLFYREELKTDSVTI